MSYEQLRDPYEGDFDEYLEIWIQFGYVCLFTSIYEYAPVCALLATIIEIRNDAHKFCNLFQRPEEWNFKIIQLYLFILRVKLFESEARTFNNSAYVQFLISEV